MRLRDILVDCAYVPLVAADLWLVSVGYIAFIMLVWSGQREFVLWLARNMLGDDE